MINTIKASTVKAIEDIAKSMDIKLNIDFNALPIHQVERLAQAFKDAGK